jgi:hypothetical protein
MLLPLAWAPKASLGDLLLQILQNVRRSMGTGPAACGAQLLLAEIVLPEGRALDMRLARIDMQVRWRHDLLLSS